MNKETRKFIWGLMWFFIGIIVTATAADTLMKWEAKWYWLVGNSINLLIGIYAASSGYKKAESTF